MAGWIHGRYEIEEPPLAKGGMGIIYKTFDHTTQRHVAIKTMRDDAEPAAMQMFAKEWTVLAALSHPNIVDILDTGEWDAEGGRRPFFVMPLLPGLSLDRLMREHSGRLTPRRVVEIIAQACRGLHAAHERGLVHRDLKPSNIFVLRDDSVKIIDFGVAHLAGAKTSAGLKGTLPYMSPEQIRLEPPTPQSDLFSLAVVAYEALTGKKPFARATETETCEAILRHMPPAASEVNPAVPEVVARVVHAGMAKQPWHRFANCREFAESLQKAINNEALARFDATKIQSRLERAQRAAAESDLQFAAEILDELEAEGHIHPQLKALRSSVQERVRQKRIRQSIDAARIRMDEDEFPLALQKIQDALDLDAANVEALSLKAEIDKRRSERQSANWLALARQHLQTQSFEKAREALREVLRLNPADTAAVDLIGEANRREQEFVRMRDEKERLYQAAVAAFEQGELSSAMTRMEQLLDLNQKSPHAVIPERDSIYQDFYNRVRSENDFLRHSYAEGKRLLASGDFDNALRVCDEALEKRPGYPLFQALKLEAEEQQRQQCSAYIAGIMRRLDAEKDLNRRVDILGEALEQCPGEPQFEQALRLTRSRRDLVGSIVTKARQYEDRGQYTEALTQWDTVRNIHPEFPGLPFEIERINARREQHLREQDKSRFVEEIDRCLEAGAYARAQEVAAEGLRQFENDGELLRMGQLARQGASRTAEAHEWLAKGRQLYDGREFAESLNALRKAAELDAHNKEIRTALLSALVERARALFGRDWRAADPLVTQALELEPTHAVASGLAALIADYRKQEGVDQFAARARELQVQGDLAAALQAVEQGLSVYPGESRLLQLRTVLKTAIGAVAPSASRAAHLEQLATLQVRSAQPMSAGEGEAVLATVRSIRSGHPDDSDVASLAEQVEQTLAHTQAIAAAPGGLATEVLGEPLLPPQPPLPVMADEPPVPPPVQALATSSAAGLFAHLRKGKVPLAAVGIAILAVTALAVYLLRHRTPPPPSNGNVRLEVRTEPAGAEIRMNGQPQTFPADLAPGIYKLEATRLGFKPALLELTLPASGQKQPVLLTLEPEPQVLRVVAPLSTGRVLIDGQGAGELQDGSLVTEVTVAGEHNVTIADRSGELVSFRYRMQPGRPAVLIGPVRARGNAAIVVSNLGPESAVFSSGSAAVANLDGNAVPIPAEGLLVKPVPTSGAVDIADSGWQQRVTLENSPAPVLSVWVRSDRNIGTLAVDSNVEEAAVYLNGEQYRRGIQKGHWLANLEPKSYHVRVVSEGYEDAEQTIEVKKGESSRLNFELHPRVVMAGLSITGGTPGAEIRLDNKQVGVLDASGGFRMDIAPGEYTIEFRKALHEPAALKRKVAAGQSIALTAAQAQLRPFGSLEFSVSPNGAKVTYRREGETQSSPAESGQTVQLREGWYTVEAVLEKHESRRERVQVTGGKATAIRWSLQPVKVEAAPVRVTLTTRDHFTNADQWKAEEDGWFSIEGDGYSWFRSSKGTIQLEIRKGKRGVLRRRNPQWVVGYRDERNHVLYSMGGELTRKSVVDGRSNQESFDHSMNGDYYAISITIEPRRIVHRDSNGVVIDDFPVRTGDFTQGRFGFKGPVTVRVKE